jgi:hypothetical protein
MLDVIRMLKEEGLAEKWAAFHNYINSIKNLPLLQNSQIKLHHATIPSHDDNVYDNSIMFEIITMDEDYDTHAMEVASLR